MTQNTMKKGERFMRRKMRDLGNIKCECGYQNHIDKIQKFGTCKGCGKVLDEKAKYRYEMYTRLRLWRGKAWG